MSTLADRLKQLRGNRSQAQIAGLLGVKQQTYAAYESGRCEPDISKIIKISQENGVTSDWLLTGGGAAPISTGVIPRDRRITDEDVSKIIDQNSKLSNAAEALGGAHKELMVINGELSRELVEMCKESRNRKACTPAPRHAKTGGGSAQNTAVG